MSHSLLLLYAFLLAVNLCSIAVTTNEVQHHSTVHIRQFCGSEEMYSQCMTLQECLSNVTTCFKSNRTLIFESGTHDVQPNTYFYLIENITNIVLMSSGSKKMQDGFEAIIKCSRWASFAFINIKMLTIFRIQFRNCGVNITQDVLSRMSSGVHSPFKFREGQNVALFLLNVYNLILNNTVVANSLGIGLVGINVLGESTVYQSIFNGSNHDNIMKTDLDCSNHKFVPQCNGGNALFLYTEPAKCTDAYNVSMLTISNTTLTRGINYVNISNGISYDPVAGTDLVAGAGLSVLLAQASYIVNVNLLSLLSIANNGFKGANVYIVLYSTIKDSNVYIENAEIREANNNPSSYPAIEEGEGGGVYYEYGKEHIENYTVQCETSVVDKGENLTVNVTLKNSNLFHNHGLIGGGIVVRLHLPPTDQFIFHHYLLIKEVTFDSNYAFYGAAIYITELQYKQILHGSSLIDIVFATEITNVHVKDSKAPKNGQRGVDIGIASAVFFNGLHSTAYLDNLVVDSNQCMGMLLSNSILVCNGVRVSNNNNSLTNGGGITLLGDTFFALKPNSTFIIANNTAKYYGGGIYIPNALPNDFQPPCFYQVFPKSEVPEVTNISHYNAIIALDNNTAESGHDIYGGDLDKCYLIYWDVKSEIAFNMFVNYTKGRSQVTSVAKTVCFCVDGVPECSNKDHTVYAYPGKQFNISAVAVGQLNGTTSSNTVMAIPKNTTKHNIIKKRKQTLVDSHEKCSNLTYVIQNVNDKTTQFYVLIFGVLQQYYWKTVTVIIESCPPFFYLPPNNKTCTCVDLLTDYLHVDCLLTEADIGRPGGTYVGYNENCTYAYSFCPMDRCHKEMVYINTANQTNQCVNHREGLLCGQCKQGYSRVLGSNDCSKCSNIHLLLLIPFAFIGIILVWFLSFSNLTVSTGAINGIIFYANIVHFNNNILYPNLDKRNPLTIFIAWLNLDLGIHTCFFNGMNQIHQSVLQFTFPLYLWFLALLAIYLTRHYSIMYRILGQHSTPALATIFLLSFNKLLNVAMEIFSVVTLHYECDNGSKGTTQVWWFDANIPYIGKKHGVLFLVAIIITVFAIAPYILLLTTSPILQRLTHFCLFKWINRVKPFVDAYEGPYNVSSRYWTGFLLCVRVSLLLAFTLNREGSIQLQLLFIIMTALFLFPLVVKGKGIYRSQLLNFHEALSIANLACFSAVTQYCINIDQQTSGKCQTIASNISLSIIALQFLAVVLIYVSKKLLDICGIVPQRNTREQFGKLFSKQRKIGAPGLYTPLTTGTRDNNYNAIHGNNNVSVRDLWNVSVPGYREPLLNDLSF